jgi:hypothetical protein
MQGPLILDNLLSKPILSKGQRAGFELNFSVLYSRLSDIVLHQVALDQGKAHINPCLFCVLAKSPGG